MRDERVYEMHKANYSRLVLMFRQFEFLNTRQLAYEQVLSNRWNMLKAVLSPEWLTRSVDNRQKELLAKCREEEKKARMMPKIVAVSGNGHG